MSQYYKNKKTKNTFRMYKDKIKGFRVWKIIHKQYFDGLWESYSEEEHIGNFKTKKITLESMCVKN